MSKTPEWCPESVWHKARGIAAAWAMPETEYGCAAAVALALVDAERRGIERAAGYLQENWPQHLNYFGFFEPGEAAAAIRQLAEADK